MKQKMKQLMGIMISLVMVLEGAGGLTVCAAEQTEPNAIEQRLQIDDVIYYNAKSRSFASSTQQFYYDLLSAPVDDSKYGWAYQFSRAELWMYLALCLDPGCPDRDLLYMESEIRGHKLSPLKYIYNNGKDEFYTGMAAYIAQEMSREYKSGWWQEVLSSLGDQSWDLPSEGEWSNLVDSLDVANCLRLIDRQWDPLFRRLLSKDRRAFANELMRRGLENCQKQT